MEYNAAARAVVQDWGLRRKEAVLARRRALQVRTFVARRVCYREMMGRAENAGAGAP
jgi:uncharacterized protein YijF (DUF1287 family)